jgi:hypothetical protein
MRKVQFGLITLINHCLILIAVAEPKLLEPMLYCVLALGVVGCIYLYSSDYKKSNHLQDFYDR